METTHVVIAVLIFLVPGLVNGQSVPDRMPPVGIDTLVSHFRGMPEGIEVHSLAATKTGFRYTEFISIPGVMVRTSNIEFDSSLNVLRARSAGTVGKHKMGSDVAYRALRARGHATPLESANGADVTIDTLLPKGAFDGLALYPVLLSRALKVGTVDTITVFDTDEMNITRQVFRVVESEQFQLPSGSQRALRAELSTTQLPVTIWFTEARPHRLLRVSSDNGESVRVH